eukprot:scaffold7053_cov134-Isochrysis_galbana.AAC.1
MSREHAQPDVLEQRARRRQALSVTLRACYRGTPVTLHSPYIGTDTVTDLGILSGGPSSLSYLVYIV